MIPASGNDRSPVRPSRSPGKLAAARVLIFLLFSLAPRLDVAAEKTPGERSPTLPSFQNDFEVTGPLSVELYVSSSAIDTDFTAKLVDVWPNGYAQNLTDGILRMRYRNTQEKAESIKPGTVYAVTIDLAATSNVFLPGHKLRLEVSSSNFPRFDRNLNTGEEQARGTRMVKATNTVWHDQAHPSALILPVVPQQSGCRRMLEHLLLLGIEVNSLSRPVGARCHHARDGVRESILHRGIGLLPAAQAVQPVRHM
jgi:hypothetical protein